MIRAAKDGFGWANALVRLCPWSVLDNALSTIPLELKGEFSVS